MAERDIPATEIRVVWNRTMYLDAMDEWMDEFTREMENYFDEPLGQWIAELTRDMELAQQELGDHYFPEPLDQWVDQMTREMQLAQQELGDSYLSEPLPQRSEDPAEAPVPNIMPAEIVEVMEVLTQCVVALEERMNEMDQEMVRFQQEQDERRSPATPQPLPQRSEAISTWNWKRILPMIAITTIAGVFAFGSGIWSSPDGPCSSYEVDSKLHLL